MSATKKWSSSRDARPTTAGSGQAAASRPSAKLTSSSTVASRPAGHPANGMGVDRARAVSIVDVSRIDVRRAAPLVELSFQRLRRYSSDSVGSETRKTILLARSPS